MERSELEKEKFLCEVCEKWDDDCTCTPSHPAASDEAPSIPAAGEEVVITESEKSYEDRELYSSYKEEAHLLIDHVHFSDAFPGPSKSQPAHGIICSLMDAEYSGYRAAITEVLKWCEEWCESPADRIEGGSQQYNKAWVLKDALKSRFGKGGA